MAAPLGPYTPAVRAGDVLYCSGQLGLHADGSLAESFEDQVRHGIDNLKALLEANGFSVADVVKTTVFLADMGDFATMNPIYAEHFGGHAPARSCVAVAGLPKGARFEIEAVAYRG